MPIHRHSQSVSLAHRYWNNLWSHERNREVYGAQASREGLGSNLRVELEAFANGEFDFSPVAKKIKDLLDHRSLFDDEPTFSDKPSTLEGMTCFIAEQVFKEPVQGGHWSSVTVWELDRFGCRRQPGSGFIDFKFCHRNLTLTLRGSVREDTQLAVDRAHVEAILEGVFGEFSTQKYEAEFMWLNDLFAAIQRQLPNLRELMVDLGSHKAIKVDDSATSLG